MTIGANDNIIKVGTTKTLEANGASTSTAAIVQANDASYSISADGESAPDAEFVLGVAFSTYTSIENKTISLYARELNVDGTADVEAPTTTFKNKFIGSFLLSAASAMQYCKCFAERVPREADYYLLNESGQTMSAGWTLKVTPTTNGPHA